MELYIIFFVHLIFPNVVEFYLKQNYYSFCFEVLSTQFLLRQTFSDKAYNLTSPDSSNILTTNSTEHPLYIFALRRLSYQPELDCNCRFFQLSLIFQSLKVRLANIPDCNPDRQPVPD